MIWLLLALALGLALLYRGVPLRAAITAYTLLWLCHGVFGDSWTGFILAGLLLGSIALVLLNAPLRQEWLVRPALDALRRRLGALAERAPPALDRSEGWTRALMTGAPDWNEWLALPTPQLSAAEQAFLDGPVSEFCRLCDAWRITTQDRDLPPEAWAFLKQHRFFGLTLPAASDGLGFSAHAVAATLQRLATSPGGLTAAMAVAAANGLNLGPLLRAFGSEAQKQQLLPRLARGEEIACWASPSAIGIEATPVHATVCHGSVQGQRVIGLRLDFEQPAVTLAPLATLVGLVVEVRDPTHLCGSQDAPGLALLLLPRETPGLEIGGRHWPLNAPFMTGPVRGRGVFVPLEQVIGGPAGIGQGRRMLDSLQPALTTLPVTALAAAQAAFAALASGAYAQARLRSQDTLDRNEQVQALLGQLAAQAYAAQGLLQMSAQAIDGGELPLAGAPLLQARALALWQASASTAMAVHGSRGAMRGPSNWIAGSASGAPLAVALDSQLWHQPGQALLDRLLLRAHPRLQALLAAVQAGSAAEALDRGDAVLLPQVGHVLRLAARALLLGISDGRGMAMPGDDLERRVCQRASRYSATVALVAELLLWRGGERLRYPDRAALLLCEAQARLLVLSGALRRYHRAGRPAQDRVLLQLVLETEAQGIEAALDAVLSLLPNPLLRATLHALLFPLGRRAQGPNEALLQAAGQGLLQPGGLRLRLAEGLDTDAAAPAGWLERVLAELDSVEPLLQTLRRALRSGRLRPGPRAALLEEARNHGLLGEDELQRLQAALRQADGLCAPDEFDPRLHRVSPRAES